MGGNMLFPKEFQWLLIPLKECQGGVWDYKEEWGAYRFLVADKMFAMLGSNKTGEDILTVKGEPEKNEQYRTMYQSVQSGYYMNKEHWISISLTSGEVSPDFIKERLIESYQLIAQKLPKKTRQALLSGEEIK